MLLLPLLLPSLLLPLPTELLAAKQQMWDGEASAFGAIGALP